ncbi:MAG TPA: DNA recombination protein RmuC [Ktedonobacterales bacterium]
MTNDQMLIALIGVAAVSVVLVFVLLGYLLGARGRPRGGKGDLVTLPPGAEALAPAFTELRTQLGDLRGQIEQMRLADAAQQARLGQEDQAWQSIGRVESSLAQLGQLPSLQQSLQEQVSAAIRDLAALKEWQAKEQSRWQTEDDAFGRLQRLTNVLLGSSTSGQAGERVVQEVIDNLPPQWRDTNHAVNGRRVEFALRLPDGLILPIDSKVVSQAELDAVETTSDPGERERLERGIRTNLLKRVSEVRQYVDARTVGYAVAAVPDAAYRLSGAVLPRAFQEHRALVVPFSLLAPFILMVYEQHLRAADLDGAQVSRLVADAQQHLESAARLLNSQFGSALTQLTNAREHLTRELAAAGSALEQMRRSTGERQSA